MRRTIGLFAKPTKPFLVVGESIVAPLMAICLREQGLEAHIFQRPPEKQSIDLGSIVLPPMLTNYLTEDLGLGGVRPQGNMLTSFYTYDNQANILMNLNLDSLRGPDSGTFFCSQRSIIEKLLLRECEKSRHFLTHDNPIVSLDTQYPLVGLSQGHGGVKARFSSGKTALYTGVINVSRDMDAVPLINDTHEVALAKRKEYSTTFNRARDQAPFYFDWTIPVPTETWELSHDEVAEIVHREGRRLFARPVSDKELSVTMTAPRRGALENCQTSSMNQHTGSTHYNMLRKHWETGDPITHSLWTQSLLPAMQLAVRHNYKRINYASPTYCFDDWTEEGGRIIRVGPAAHGATAQ
eukprot:gene17849-27509_t